MNFIFRHARSGTAAGSQTLLVEMCENRNGANRDSARKIPWPIPYANPRIPLADRNSVFQRLAISNFLACSAGEILAIQIAFAESRFLSAPHQTVPQCAEAYFNRFSKVRLVIGLRSR